MPINSKNDYEQLKRRNRRRLAGAVALVLIAAIILLLVLNRKPTTVSAASELVVSMPEVQVTGAASADAASAGMPSSAAVPLPDLTEPDAASGPVTQAAAGIQNSTEQNVQNSGVTNTVPAAKPTDPAVEMRKPQQPETQREPAKTPAKSQPAAKQKPTPVKQQPARTEDINSRGLTPEEILNNRAASVMKNAKTAAPADSAAGTGRIIQVGAYSSKSQAEDVNKRLAAAGVSAHVVSASTSKGTVYRVRTGSYRNQDAVQKALATIRAQGFDGMVMSR